MLGAQLVQKTGDTGRWGKTGLTGQVLQHVGGTVIKPLLALNTWGIGNKMFSADYVMDLHLRLIMYRIMYRCWIFISFPFLSFRFFSYLFHFHSSQFISFIFHVHSFHFPFVS